MFITSLAIKKWRKRDVFASNLYQIYGDVCNPIQYIGSLKNQKTASKV